MAKDWRGYQEEAAAFFRKLGLDAKVDHEVTGARGNHMIDVWVTHSRFGIKVKWVVECKFWSSAVPKEKVMALMQISQDVGADRAFLLSEKGFQSGAISAAKNTNVVLSSLEMLCESASHEMAEAEITLFARHLGNIGRPGEGVNVRRRWQIATLQWART